ncbi:DUF397 domain-containing protein [Streptomyces sp. NPDC059499]|uniref:DUF397 domain-containing protein n=1 Tax=Streptomyces sp. NPDC059499 TaxID=3346852 RepID=UPI0036AA2662
MPRTNIEVPDSAWFKSSYSGGNETECVETAVSPIGASVRDSKRPHEGHFHIGAAAWADFIGSVRQGDLS